MTIVIEEEAVADGLAYGTFAASGGVFGATTAGKETCTDFAPHFAVGNAWGRGGSLTYVADCEYSTESPAGTFTIRFEGEVHAVSYDAATQTYVDFQTGNWKVTTGTGHWAGLQALGKFTEPGLYHADSGDFSGTLFLAGRVR